MFATDIHKLQILNDLISQTLDAIERRAALWTTTTPYANPALSYMTAAGPQLGGVPMMQPHFMHMGPQVPMFPGWSYFGQVPQYGASQSVLPHLAAPQYGVSPWAAQMSGIPMGATQLGAMPYGVPQYSQQQLGLGYGVGMGHTPFAQAGAYPHVSQQFMQSPQSFPSTTGVGNAFQGAVPNGIHPSMNGNSVRMNGAPVTTGW